MNRRTIPSLQMSDYGQDGLREQGVVVMPLEISMSQEPQRLIPHFHDFFQLFLIQGPARLMHDFREYDVTGITLFFLSPGQVHTIYPRSNSMRGTVASFTQAFFDHQLPPPSMLVELPFFFASGAPPWFSVEKRKAARLMGLFGDLQREYDGGQRGVMEVLRSLLRILLIEASRIETVGQPVKEATRAALLARQFQLALEHHFREWQALAPYAKQLGITVNHLNDVIREETGHAAGELIRHRRLLDAKRLLLHSDLSVSEIGYQIGFQDPSYFSRFFRRYAGATPADFREAIREKYH
ncbi:helix-turn-helix domain-containing protein [Prosthecobacter dejongeii]|uniref:AraC-like DNA-binding protein n=1 Tax=Prosthecobacter dejongeii TaxID=48465 RepID=A0A7W8DP36_9BACT|nr:helix-turn-helix domain-containing protein [Prosthecobacter dejongeii]MBB5036546.1 AraC-like DNA-binding protein [Prosthecobacter dejongeii]